MARSTDSSSRSTRQRLEDPAEIEEALDHRESVSLMLCRDGDISVRARALVERARAEGIPVAVEPEREMRRMSAAEAAPDVIALVAPVSPATLDELMMSDGLVLVLVGLRYPGNVGFILRSAEVAGAAGVVLVSDWQGTQIEEALRVGIRADRFFPVIESEANLAISAARRARRRIIALETTGSKSPWTADLRSPSVIVVGGEATGLSPSLLDAADEVIRIPTRGFIPSYNVQAAASMLLGEWLRQNSG